MGGGGARERANEKERDRERDALKREERERGKGAGGGGEKCLLHHFKVIISVRTVELKAWFLTTFVRPTSSFECTLDTLLHRPALLSGTSPCM